MSVATPSALTCQELVELVTDFLEGRMGAEERLRFEMHVTDCAGCGAYLRQIQDTIRVVGKLSEEDLPQAAQRDLLHAFRGWKRR